jgi:hypothetical protein
MKRFKSLQFHCGELINMQINPNSRQLSTIPNAVRRACRALMQNDFPVDFLRCFEEAMASSDLPLLPPCS